MSGGVVGPADGLSVVAVSTLFVCGGGEGHFDAQTMHSARMLSARDSCVVRLLARSMRAFSFAPWTAAAWDWRGVRAQARLLITSEPTLVHTK